MAANAPPRRNFAAAAHPANLRRTDRVRSFFAGSARGRTATFPLLRASARGGGGSSMIGRIAAPLLAATLFAIGCGGSADRSASGTLTFDATPFQTVHSDSGVLLLAVYAQAGHPPTRGVNALRFLVTDAHGAPVEGVQLMVSPWMPDMGHGSSVVPKVTAAGAGAVVSTDPYFAM